MTYSADNGSVPLDNDAEKYVPLDLHASCKYSGRMCGTDANCQGCKFMCGAALATIDALRAELADKTQRLREVVCSRERKDTRIRELQAELLTVTAERDAAVGFIGNLEHMIYITPTTDIETIDDFLHEIEKWRGAKKLVDDANIAIECSTKVKT